MKKILMIVALVGAVTFVNAQDAKQATKKETATCCHKTAKASCSKDQKEACSKTMTEKKACCKAESAKAASTQTKPSTKSK